MMAVGSLIIDEQRIDALAARWLKITRQPGTGVAIVTREGTAFARGYGVSDLASGRAMDSDTSFSIASTSKAFNALLIAILVEEGHLNWDRPICHYLPSVPFKDKHAAASATLCDCIAMRTGLPRHDWTWLENEVERSDLVRSMAYLEPSAGFREKFQYNNLTATLAGHVAETVTGQSWEALVRQRILEPLGMRRTSFGRPNAGKVSKSYHETQKRVLVETPYVPATATGPSGGTLWSSLEDMGRWAAFNLGFGNMLRGIGLGAEGLADLHRPRMIVGGDTVSISEGCAYALGWFVDTLGGIRRVSHGGYLYDFTTDVSLFSDLGFGLVSFGNFGCPIATRLLNEHLFALLTGAHVKSLEDHRADYERKISETAKRNGSVPRTAGTGPSHALSEYAGSYHHPAYGTLAVTLDGDRLQVQRGALSFSLDHWHYDHWAPTPSDAYPIHLPNPFERANLFSFETSKAGEVAAIRATFEPAAAPIRFERVGK